MRMRRGLPAAVVLFAGALAASWAQGPGPLKVGDEEHRRVETPHPVPLVGANEEAWSDVFTWPEASYIAVHFAEFDLAPGERVVVATPDGRYSYTFEGEGKPTSGGTFWATHVPGDTCVVTYYGNGNTPGYGYVVDKFVHGYPPSDLPGSGGNTEAICAGADDSQEARCYEISEPTIYDRSRAVARLLIAGSSLCTGWLVGCDGHVMTNAHCITSASDALNTDFEFMAEGDTCLTPCNVQLACPGPIEASTSTLIKRDLPRDYALVLLPTNVTSTYGYLRLREAGPVLDERIYMPQHPMGWGKRIAVTSTDVVEDPSGFCEVNSLNGPECQAGGPPDVEYSADTQGGSSGSPVLAYSDHVVVSLHHCNSGAGVLCPNRGVPIQSVIQHLRDTDDVPRCAVTQLAGTVELDAPSYICSVGAGIRVRDDHLVGAGTQAVTIFSSTEPQPETVNLTETPANSGTFIGSFPLTTDPPVNGDGRLSVAHNGTITVQYVDADDGAGGTNLLRADTATIDCLPLLVHQSHDPTDSCVGTGGGGGDGVVDPGEDVVFSVALLNAGTRGVTGVSASLSTSMPGVTVTRGTASYPDMPPGSAARSDSPHFAFTVGTGVSCGIELSFTIQVIANEGSWTDTFSVQMGAPNVTMTTYPSSDVPTPIIDGLTTTSEIVVANPAVVGDVDVEISITHTFVSDLDIFLIGPNGTRVELTTGNGGSGDNYTNTIFDDEAATSITQGSPPFTGRFRPETPLSALDGIPGNGTWTLEMTDNFLQDEGALTAWSITLTTGAGFVCNDCSVEPPGVTTHLWSSKSGMQWPSVPTASYYNVYRGEPVDLPKLLDASMDSCKRVTTGDLVTGDVLTETPAAGSFYWYLVRAANAGGEGPAGNASAGPRTQDGSGSCP